MKKILLTIILGIFFISIVSAMEYDHLGKQYTDIKILETCTIDGFSCPADFLCNITIDDPEHKLVVLNSLMTKNETIYNYTLTSSDLLGYYSLNIYCGNATLSGHKESILKVTTTGREPNMMITILLLLCSLGLYLLALYIKSYPIGFISGTLFSVAGMYMMIYGLGDLADMYTRSIAMVTILFGGFIVLVSSIEWIEEIEGN